MVNMRPSTLSGGIFTDGSTYSHSWWIPKSFTVRETGLGDSKWGFHLTQVEEASCEKILLRELARISRVAHYLESLKGDCFLTVSTTEYLLKKKLSMLTSFECTSSVTYQRTAPINRNHVFDGIGLVLNY